MAKILIIDDEAQMCEFIKSYLEKRGYEVIVSLTGKEALEVYPKVNPDLVLLDLGLPDTDGRSILKEIKAKMPQIKVMVVSAYKDQATQDELIKLGADYFLGKPFMVPKLYELIKDIVKS
jgi:DNA-binding response OmpR family regulator